MTKASLKNIGVLFFGVVTQRAANFMLVALLTYFLTPAEYASFGLLTSVIALATMLIALGIPTAPTRLLFDYKGLERDNFVKSTLIYTLIFGAALLLPLAYALHFIRIDNQQLFAHPISLLVMLSVVFTAIIEHTRATLRALGNFWAFIIINNVRHLGLVALIAFMFTQGGITFIGTVFCQSLALMTAALVGFFSLWQKISHGHLKRQFFKPAVHFGLPVALSGLFGWLLVSSGQWLGSHYLGLAAMAPYILAVQITNIINMVPRMTFESRIPDIGESISAQKLNEGHKIVFSTSILNAAGICIIYFLIWVALYVIGFQLPKGYELTSTILLCCFILNLVDVYFLHGYQTLMLYKDTKAVALWVALSSAITIVFTYFTLTHGFGMPGLFGSYITGLLFSALVLHLKAFKRRTRAQHHAHN